MGLLLSLRLRSQITTSVPCWGPEGPVLWVMFVNRHQWFPFSLRFPPSSLSKACLQKAGRASSIHKEELFKNLFIYSLTFNVCFFLVLLFRAQQYMLGISTDSTKSSVNFSPKIKMKVELSSFLSVLPAPLAHFQLGEWKGKGFFKGTSLLCS